MFDLYTRLDVKRPAFRKGQSKKHARTVVETACARLQRRFPPGGALRTLIAACDRLVDEHDDALVRLLVDVSDDEESQKPSLSTSKLSNLSGCSESELQAAEPWRSPWSTRHAEGAARAAVEAGQHSPSDLVERLVKLPEARLLDYSVDPEGTGEASGGGGGAAAKTKKKKKKRAKGRKGSTSTDEKAEL